MSMKLDGRIHPEITRIADECSQQYMWSGSTTLTPDKAKAVNNHRTVWTKQYGKGCFALFIVYGASFIAAVSAKPFLGKPWTGLVIMSVMFAAAIHLYLGYQANRKRITTDELAALLPALELS